MNTPKRTHPWTLLAAGLFCAMATGCASLTTPSTPEEAVKQRASLSLKARKAGEFEKAYEMTTPGYRAVAKLIRFKAENVAVPTWVSAEVVNVSCEEPVKCVAKIKVDFKPILGARVGDVVTTHIDETWLQEDGQWWQFPKL